MIRFKRLVLRNFLSYGDYDTVFDLASQGSTLITGLDRNSKSHNGVGKSAIIDGYIWTLFGKPLRQSNVGDIINFNIARNTVGILEFELDGRTWRIERYRKHDEHQNAVYVFVDDEQIERFSSTTEDQRALERLIGIDYYTYTNNYVYTSDSENILALTPSKRLSALERRLGLDSFTVAAKLARSNIRDLEVAASNTKTKLALFQDQLAKARKELTTLREKSDNWEKEHSQRMDTLIKDIRELEEKLSEIEDHSEQLSSLEAKLHETEQQIKEIESEIDSIDSTVARFERNVKAIDNGISAAKHKVDKELAKLAATVSAAKEKFEEKLKLLQAERCPTCERPWEEHGAILKERYVKEIRLIEEEAKEKADVLERKLKEEIERLQQKKIEYDTTQLFECRSALVEQLERARAARRTIEVELARLHNVEDLRATITRQLKEKRRSLSSPITNPYTELIESTTATIEECKENIFALQSEIEDIEDKQYYYRLWADAFGGSLKHFVVQQILPILNSRLQSALKILFPGRSVDITVFPNLDYKLVIDGNTASYWNLSQGERKRFDVAMFMAMYSLAMYINSRTVPNVLWFDEVFDSSLDSAGINSVASLIRTLEAESIFVITHRVELASLFDGIIEVEKVNGFTRIRG